MTGNCDIIRELNITELDMVAGGAPVSTKIDLLSGNVSVTSELELKGSVSGIAHSFTEIVTGLLKDGEVFPR